MALIPPPRLPLKNTKALCDGLLKRGVNIVSGGTVNHLLIIDFRDSEMTGKEMEKLLEAANITSNKNTVHNDPRSPFVTSGIRLGAAAVTTRGMNEADMDKIAEAIAMIIDNVDNTAKAKAIVKELTDAYPLEV